MPSASAGPGGPEGRGAQIAALLGGDGPSTAPVLSALEAEAQEAAERRALFRGTAGTRGPGPKELLAELVARERARESLVAFAQFLDSAYQPYQIHHLIAQELERVARGALRRLAIFVPPAIGKSRLASEFFPAWFLGRNPTLELIECSYDYKLAAGFGRNVRNLVKDPRFELLFPGVSVAADSSAMDSWKTQAGGEYKAEGVGGGLIGFHGHIAILDDPVKDYTAASSAAARESLWNWYTGVLLNRLRAYKDGPGAVILIMQRWHDDDLGGRIEKLVEKGEEDWRIIRVPSLAEEGDPLGRAPGEALLPEGPNRRPVDELRRIQARNPRLFHAVHQQQPVSAAGDIFRREWFQYYSPADLPSRLTHYITTDYALSEGRGDYTVLVLAGVCAKGHLWILDLWREQCQILRGVQKTVEWMAQFGAARCFVERTGMARVVEPLLAKERAAAGAWTVVEKVQVLGKGAKDSPERAGAFAGAMQLGYVHLPRNAEWLGTLEYELTKFPNGAHDDQVDALALLGMRLAALRRASSAPEQDKKAKQAGKALRFSDALAINKRHRLGLRPRIRIYASDPGPSPLDEPALEGRN